MDIDSSNLGDADIQTLRQAEEELQRRKREDPLKNVYTPHDFQKKVHKSRNEITLVLGGNRTGKTYCAVAETLFVALGRSEHAEVPEPPNKIWYVIPTSDTYDEAILPVMRELCPMNKVENVDKRKRRWKFENGSTITFRTTDQRQKRMTGASVDLIITDEPVPKSFYEELQARILDSGGRILMVLTPVGNKTEDWLWIRDELYIPWENNERPDIGVIHMPVADPETGEPLVPHFTKADIERMKRQWPDPQVRRARMYGDFVTRSGLVFGQFDEDVHLVDPFRIPQNWHEWLVCDPQYHRFAVLMFAADEEGSYYVTDEYFSTDEPLAHRAERIKAMVGERESDIPMYVDYANPQDIAELNYHFRRTSAPVGAMELPFTKRVEKMILRTHSMLEPDVDRTYHRETGLGDTYGAPRLLFFSDLHSSWEQESRQMSCSRLFWEMKRLSWDGKGKPDKDSAGGGDATDCLIYGCSIPASGYRVDKKEQWKKDLSRRDVRIHEMMEQQDQRQRLKNGYPTGRIL